jgi:hypothetical protein
MKRGSSDQIPLSNKRIVKLIPDGHKEELFKAFSEKNTHKTRGSVRVPKAQQGARIALRSIALLDTDTDVIFTKVGTLTGFKTHNGGGNIQSNGNLHVVFWGEKWLNEPPSDPSMDDIVGDINTLLTSPYFFGLAQYGPIVAPKLAGIWVSHRGPPHLPFTMADVNYQCWLLMTSGPIPDDADTIVCLICPPGAKPSDNSLNGEHDHSLQPSLYWIPTMWIEFGDRATVSTIISHELVEALTDPNGDGIQIEPTGVFDWHEIADVCEGFTDTINGVTVQSYWSKEDNACIVPIPVPVESRQIMCVDKGGRALSDPKHHIAYVGGVHIPSQTPFTMDLIEVITRIDMGQTFFVDVDGHQARVIVKDDASPWAAKGNKIIATAPDDTKVDNLLSLPQCPPRPR